MRPPLQLKRTGWQQRSGFGSTVTANYSRAVSYLTDSLYKEGTYYHWIICLNGCIPVKLVFWKTRLYTHGYQIHTISACHIHR